MMRKKFPATSRKGWAMWAAAVVIMLLLSGIVWTLVAAH